MIGEEGSEYAVVREPIDRYRIKVYFMSLHLIVTELESRFSENDLALLCVLSDLVLSSTPNQEYCDMVAD